MTTRRNLRRTIGLAEISALIIGTLGISAGLIPDAATATPAPPWVVSSAEMFPGTTITSPWVLDTPRSAHWAIGVDSLGVETVIRRDAVSGEFSTIAANGEFPANFSIETSDLLTPIIGTGRVWYSTDTSPARIMAIDTETNTVVADFVGPTGSERVTALALDPREESAWFTTSVTGAPILVNMRLSDGAITSTTPLDSSANPHSVFVSDYTVDVVEASNTRVTRFALIDPPQVPANVLIEDRSEGAVVSWTPDSVSEAPVHYLVSLVGHGLALECETTGSRCVFDGLTNGAEYMVEVRATSVVSFTYSGIFTARPATVPARPLHLFTLASGRNRTVVVCASHETGGRRILALRARVIRNGVPAESLKPSAGTVVRIGRGVVQSIAIEVRAINAAGQSEQLTITADVNPTRVSSVGATLRNLPRKCDQRKLTFQIRP
jgi:hypothetical protein